MIVLAAGSAAEAFQITSLIYHNFNFFCHASEVSIGELRYDFYPKFTYILLNDNFRYNS